jgi:hypothetical protein
MKAFILPADCRLQLLKTTPHKENHGPEKVQAVSLKLCWTTTNDNLSTLHPRLKDALYWREPQDEAQETIEGVEQITPNLRVPTVEGPLKVKAELSGYTFHIDHGIDEDSALELYVCDLSKFAVDAKEGGSVSITWSLHSNKEITPELVGALCGLEGCEIVATLTPPAVATGDVIDGTQDAFDADHPGEDDGQADLLAGDAFAAAHGA